MIHSEIKINLDNSEFTAYLKTYLLENSKEMNENKKRPIIIICPGGGYEFVSEREAEPVAVQFLSMGYHCAILKYSVFPAKFPEALLQLAKSVQYFRQNCDKYFIDENKIILMGFSAGGHLAGSLGVLWDSSVIKENLSLNTEEFKPNGLILCYPVITSGEKTHKGSMKSLLGENYNKLLDNISLEKLVNKNTPKTFLWHTMYDDCVPMENSLLFFQALKNNNIEAELHIYPVGGHGLSLATEETSLINGYGIQKECESWLYLLKNWLKNNY